MEVEIVAIGNPSKIEKIASEFTYAHENDVFLISIPKNLQKYTVSCLESEDILTMTLSQFQKSLVQQKKAAELSKLDNSVFDWVRNELEYFHVTFSNCFELVSLDKKSSKTIHKIDGVTRCVLSNNGTIYAFIKSNAVSFCVGDNLDLLFDLKLKDQIDDLIFSKDDSTVKILSGKKEHTYDIFKGCPASQRTSHFQVADLLSASYIHKTESDGIHCEFREGILARFIDGKSQKIEFNSNGKITAKSMAHVKAVDFHMANNRLFACIVKNPGTGDKFAIESYLNGEITAQNFDHKIISISVEDDFFVVQMSTFEIQFYTKDKYSFKMIGSVTKDAPVKLACMNGMCCVYSSTGIEFYDRSVLRSAYSGCERVLWSPSGLYVAGFTYSESSGTLLQIFNNNGVLMFKKVYNSLSDFGWRGCPEIDQEERERILKEHSIDEVVDENADEGKDVDVLIEEWIEYLENRGEYLIDE